MKKQLTLLIGLLFVAMATWAQKAVVSGVIRDERDKPLDQALVADEVTGMGVHTNSKGYYWIEVPAGKKITLIYFLQGYIASRREILLPAGATRILDVQLQHLQAQEGPEVKITDQRRREQTSMLVLDASKAV